MIAGDMDGIGVHVVRHSEKAAEWVHAKEWELLRWWIVGSRYADERDLFTVPVLEHFCGGNRIGTKEAVVFLARRPLVQETDILHL